MHDTPLTHNPPAPRGLKRAGMISGGIAVLVVIAGIVSRSHETASAQKWSDTEAVPTVHLIAPTPSDQSGKLALPGTMAAWNAARIFARVPGYVGGWYRDIGAVVGSGTPLASIDTPELDQQIIQARAALIKAKAEATLARSTAARWNDLLSTASVSRQETDEKNSDAATRRAVVGEAEANLGRLLAMKRYSTVRAPFGGVVTARNADIGDLVGPGAIAPQPLFAMADESRIRTYVNVPQQYSAIMRPGLTATLTVPDWPGKSFPARVVGTSGAINSQSGALQVQLVTDNHGQMLKAGGYAQVRFDLPQSNASVTIPASALVLRASGTRVATVGPDARVRMVPVTIGHDLGRVVEITSGLNRESPIVDNPPDSITDGELVHIQKGTGASHG